MTRKDVEGALTWVLGEKIFTTLTEAGVSLPALLDMAACKAFRENLDNEPVLNKIRVAMEMLHDEGHFYFENEFED